MNHPSDSDDLDEVLVRAGDYLMRRSAQYREAPLASPSAPTPGGGRQRLVVIAAATITLCGTALAGSFIGGTSSGKVDVAKAAWSAVPATPTVDLVERVTTNCNITNETMPAIAPWETWAVAGDAPVATFPTDMLEPALIDVRGTTTTAVYFTPTHAVLCVEFGDGSMNVRVLPMGPNDGNAGNGWEAPVSALVEVQTEDSESFMATMVVGYLPSGSNWDVYLKADAEGVETVTASTHMRWERFVAWMPGDVSGVVAYVNSVTGEERSTLYGSGVEGQWYVSPLTTVTMQASDDSIATSVGDG